jgi:integrase
MRELLRAKWEHIDWDMGTLYIGLNKNGEPLLAPLSEFALERLRSIPRIAGNPRLICGLKPNDHFKNLGPVLSRVERRAGIENLRVDDLRRTVGSWLAQGGTSLHLIGDVLNQKNPSTTALNEIVSACDPTDQKKPNIRQAFEMKRLGLMFRSPHQGLEKSTIDFYERRPQRDLHCTTRTI